MTPGPDRALDGDRGSARAFLDCAGAALRYVGRCELAVAMVAFWGALGLVTAQVLTRQINVSLWWAQEWTELLVMYAYFLGISSLYQARQMIVIEFVTSRLPMRAQTALYFAAQLLVCLFCGIVAYQAIKIAPRELAFPSFVIQVPRFFWTLPLTIGSISMVLTSIFYAFAVPLAWRKHPGQGLGELERLVAFTAETRLH